MRISLYCNSIRELLEDDARRNVGGVQVRAHLFGHALGARGHHGITMVMPNGLLARRERVAGFELVELAQGGGASFLGRTTDRVLGQARPSARFPWMRLRRWDWRLLWQLPIAGLHFVLFTRQLRRGYREHVARAVEHLSADVACCFKPGMHMAGVVVGCRRAGRPVVMMIANDTDLGDYVYEGSRQWGPKWAPGHACWYSIAHADAVVVQTQWQQQRLRERFGIEGVLIRNPIDSCTHTEAGPPVETPYVLWIGRGDTDHKRPTKCFELARLCPKVRFVMIMNPVSEQQQASLKAEAPRNVQIIDRVPYDEIEAYFKHASAFVSTSAFEGFPNTFLQAGKYGVPIVSLAVDPDGFISRHGCGSVCGDDVTHMAGALRELMRNDAARQAQGRAARAYVEAHHDLAGRVSELERLLASLVAGRRDERA